MIFKTAAGSKDIVAGTQVKINPSFIPSCLSGASLAVTKIEDGYPFVHFYKTESFEDADGNIETRVLVDEESAISPELIIEVT